MISSWSDLNSFFFFLGLWLRKLWLNLERRNGLPRKQEAYGGKKRKRKSKPKSFKSNLPQTILKEGKNYFKEKKIQLLLSLVSRRKKGEIEEQNCEERLWNLEELSALWSDHRSPASPAVSSGSFRITLSLSSFSWKDLSFDLGYIVVVNLYEIGFKVLESSVSSRDSVSHSGRISFFVVDDDLAMEMDRMPYYFPSYFLFVYLHCCVTSLQMLQ